MKDNSKQHTKDNKKAKKKLLIIIAVIAGIMLILMLWIKERTYETGILLSLGEGKAMIIMQYAIEVLIIAIIAFSISIFSGNIISQKVGDILLEKELNTVNNVQENRNPMMNIERNEIEVVSNIDVSINSKVVIQLYGFGIFIVLISSIIPTILVFRYKPKKILTNL